MNDLISLSKIVKEIENIKDTEEDVFYYNFTFCLFYFKNNKKSKLWGNIFKEKMIWVKIGR